MRSKHLKLVLIALVAIPVGLYAIAAIRYISNCSSPRPSCIEYRNAGCSISGDYDLKFGPNIIKATCDMRTDGGGWTLVANYLHRGGGKTRSSVRPFIGALPIQDGDDLGGEEAGKPSWGHASTRTLSALPFREVRYHCRTSAHPRIVNFALNSPSCLTYFRTGIGACLGTPELQEEFRKSVRGLEGHTGHLPLTADKGHKDQGDNSIVDYPFFIDWKDNWSVGVRWECDDSQAEDKFNTHHQVWIR